MQFDMQLIVRKREERMRNPWRSLGRISSKVAYWGGMQLDWCQRSNKANGFKDKAFAGDWLVFLKTGICRAWA